jgi:hypothetical protein
VAFLLRVGRLIGVQAMKRAFLVVVILCTAQTANAEDPLVGQIDLSMAFSEIVPVSGIDLYFDIYPAVFTPLIIDDNVGQALVYDGQFLSLLTPTAPLAITVVSTHGIHWHFDIPLDGAPTHCTATACSDTINWLQPLDGDQFSKLTWEFTRVERSAVETIGEFNWNAEFDATVNLYGPTTAPEPSAFVLCWFAGLVAAGFHRFR